MRCKRLLSFIAAVLLAGMFMLQAMEIQAAEGMDTIPEEYTNYLSNYIPDVNGTCRTSYFWKIKNTTRLLPAILMMKLLL
jgi:hypothetical protein